ncbi:HTH-type transcriptional regulator DmlR [Grimontia celer]|uniref:HTH-type transcriptional regulator DmlR n=1 Tax=Grimontia celer TaxID=1796497 RepID=A0A128F9L6_9GAMM|nr:LysR family transcriptional regulator [Grimontia celer]CZF82971.1 HTH-type transcriptional regulator DmlR [Grimontia celer]
MNLHYLKGLAIFATVIDKGSFAKAASALGLNRSAVSEQISKLEEGLGVRLLQRTTRQLTLTADGEALYPSAKAIVNGLDSAEPSLNLNKPQGTVRVTTTYDFAANWLLPKAAGFKVQYPGIHIDYVLSDERIDLVKEKVDLAVRIANIEEAGYIARPLFKDKAGVYCSPELANQMGNTATDNNIADYPWVLFEAMTPNNLVTLSNSEKKLTFTPTHFDKTNSPTMMREMVLSGQVVGLQPDRMMEDPLNENRVVKLLPDWYGRDFYYYLLYPSRKHLSLRTRLFIDYLMQFAE